MHRLRRTQAFRHPVERERRRGNLRRGQPLYADWLLRLRRRDRSAAQTGLPVIEHDPLPRRHRTLRLCKADVRAALSDKTAAMVVNNPSNPCGCVYCKKTLDMLAGIAKERDLHVIADEIYDELVYDGREYISFPTLSEDAYERTILVNGLSKAYAMTGWRMGYTASSLKTASIMASYQSHATSNPCSITQYAGIAAMTGPQDDLASMVAEFACRRDLLVEKINAMQGVHCRKPQGAFYVMMDISSVRGKAFHGKKIENSLDFAQILLESKHVALVPGAAFGADDFARLSYATSRKNIEEGCRRIAEFLEEIK